MTQALPFFLVTYIMYFVGYTYVQEVRQLRGHPSPIVPHRSLETELSSFERFFRIGGGWFDDDEQDKDQVGGEAGGVVVPPPSPQVLNSDGVRRKADVLAEALGNLPNYINGMKTTSLSSPIDCAVSSTSDDMDYKLAAAAGTKEEKDSILWSTITNESSDKPLVVRMVVVSSEGSGNKIDRAYPLPPGNFKFEYAVSSSSSESDCWHIYILDGRTGEELVYYIHRRGANGNQLPSSSSSSSSSGWYLLPVRPSSSSAQLPDYIHLESNKKGLRIV